MKYVYWLLAVFCLIFFLAISTLAQSPATGLTRYTTIPIASPTAAALGKFTDVPVSYHTGIPEVSVPLYTIKEGPLSLPISMSYHAGGIKVQETAGWVGLGWALNAGGVITRTIMGAPDESHTTNAEFGYFSDYGFDNYWTFGGSRGNSSNARPAPNDIRFMSNLYDGEPDLFFFNFNGYSGKFYFSDDHTPVIVDGQDLKIEYYYPRANNPNTQNQGGTTSADNNIQGFIITVPSGDRYYFGNTGDLPRTATLPLEQTYNYSNGTTIVDNNVYVSYYLHKIVAADQVHRIDLTYDPERYSYYCLSTYPKPEGAASGPFPYPDKEFALAQNNINGVRLKRISFSTGQVSFTPSPTLRTDLNLYLSGNPEDLNQEARALDNVSITDNSGFCKRFAFNYSYYGGDNTPLCRFLLTNGSLETDKTRLRLDQVVEQACDGSVAAAPWRFTYNGAFLPRRLSFAQDHWGFYNGANQNSQLGTLIPTYSRDTPAAPGYETPGANRDAALPYMSMGMLTQVTYPTGGSASFEFEPNDVWTTYTKWDYLPPFSLTANQFRKHDFQSYTFKADSYYRLWVDYYRDANCTLGNPFNAYFGFGTNTNSYTPDTTLLGASATYKHDERLYSLTTLRTPPGKRRMHLSIDSNCADDAAQASIQEIVRHNVQEHAYAGGMRIKALRLKATAADTGMVTRYAYRHPSGHSSGALYVRPRYVQVVRNDILAQYGYSTTSGVTHPEGHGCLNPDNNPGEMSYLESPCSVLPMTTTQGSHIGYDVVTVTRPGSGRTEYHYTATTNLGRSYPDVCERHLVANYCDPTVPSQPMPPPAYEYDRGQLQYQADYNAQGQLVCTVRHQHSYDSTRHVTPAYIVRNIKGAMLGCFYVRRGYWQSKLITTETRYTPQAPAYSTTQVQYFDSPFHHQPTRTLTTASAGDTLETRTRYTFDVRTPGPDALDDGRADYAAACASCDVTFRNQLPNCGQDACRRDLYIDNLLCRSAARRNYVAYRRWTFTGARNQYQLQHDAAKDAAAPALRRVLQLQDEGRNEEMETSRWKNRRLLGASYTTFGPGLSQPTTLYPARQFNLLLSAPAPTFSPVTVAGNQLQVDARYDSTPELSLTFDRGALLESRPRTGIVTSYLWDYTATLPLAKTVGARHATLRDAYAATGGNVAALRGQPGLARAQLTTYTHQPLVGLRSQTDPSGRTLTYEYDALGRLVRTRDEQGRILSQQQYHYAGQ